MSRRLLDRGRYRKSICFRSLLVLLKYIKGADRPISRVALDFFKIPRTSDQASGRSCGGSWGSRWSLVSQPQVKLLEDGSRARVPYGRM